MKAYEKEFRKEHPETIGETDKDFDTANYIQWLENKAFPLSSECQSKEDGVCKLPIKSCKQCVYPNKLNL